MKKIVFALLLAGAFNFTAYCQNDSTLNSASYKLKVYLSDHVAEKAYLQFDKPFYAAGDTIYFKAYVTTGERHILSPLSGVLHVDLINTNSKIDQTIKLQIDSGIAHGDFALPDSLPNGSYRVRAYTQWMRNNDEDGFFYKTIEVGSLKNARVPESLIRNSIKINSKADMQFFPEGGSLVTGIRSKVAFKAIGTNGLGINVNGMVTDNENKEIVSFASGHLGMGYFYLSPEEGKTYKTRLTYADGTQSVMDLPNPNPKGIILLVDNDSIPKASVQIVANNAYYRENRSKPYSVVIYSGGTATTVTCKLDSPVITMDILKRRLHTGIATVTLFSSTLEPLCERLLFIQNYDQLSLSVTSDKIGYAKREKVKIKLAAINRAGNPATGNFSVSITDESKVRADENSENTIVSNLLLTSDLKGYVEQPNYYFADTSANARNNLDVLMLTQGYRRFEWKRVLDNSYAPITWQPEKGLEIDGVVKNLFGKLINKGTITLLPSKGGSLLSSVTDEKGIFHFSNLIFNDTTHFVLSAVNANGKNSTKITYFNDKPEAVVVASRAQNIQKITDTAITSLLDNDKQKQDELVKYGHAKGVMLKEVKIRSTKIDDDYHSSNILGPGHADQVMHADEIERIGGDLITSLNGRLRGVNFYYGMAYSRLSLRSGPMLLIVDGAELDPSTLSQIPSSDVETVEVLRFASASIYGMNGGRGVLIINTKQGGGLKLKDISSIGILPIAPVGFYKSREFYSPKYDNTAMMTKQRDLRSTIYWKPELVTDKDGNASFEYYNADGTGTYRVVIEGIDDKGNLGRQVFSYKVE